MGISILRSYATILNNVTFLFAVIAELLTAILCYMPKLLATVALWQGFESTFSLSCISHIEYLSTDSVLAMPCCEATGCSSRRSSPRHSSKVGTGLRLINPARTLSNSGRSFIKNWSRLLSLWTTCNAPNASFRTLDCTNPE